MSERKVLNKYFPPDFDPALIPRRKLQKDQQSKVRLMTPFSMRCNTCGEYIYKGKKFNARKETTNETYYNIKIFRFYIRCNRCAAEITFKTDPANSDYVAEHGAQRNFEPWRDEKGELAAERQEEEENNPMKALENRTQDSKREMEIMDALDEIRTRNAMMERVDSDQVIGKIASTEEDQALRIQREEDDEDERLAKAVFRDIDGDSVKRLHEETEEIDVAQVAMSKLVQPLSMPDFKAPLTKKRKQGGTLGLTVKKSAAEPGSSAKTSPQDQKTLPSSSSASSSSSSVSFISSNGTGSAPAASKPASKSSTLLSLVAAYDSSSDSD